MDPFPDNTSLNEIKAKPVRESGEIDLRELWFHLLSRWRIIALAGLVGFIFAIAYTYLIVVPQYQSTAKLYVLSSKDSVLNLADMQFGNYLASDYQEVFKTWEVNEKIRTNLGLDYSYSKLQSMVTISNPKDTRILYITVTSPSSQEAAAIANEYAKVVSEFISQTMATETPNTFSTALKSLRPITPNKTKNVFQGVVIAVLASMAIMAASFIFNDKVKSPEDIGKSTGMPTLAVVPILEAEVLFGNLSKGKKQRKHRGV